MISFFKGVFFKIYQWFKSLDLDNIPEYTAVCLLSILVTFNIVAVLMYVRYFTGYPAINIPRMPSLFTGLILMFLMYLGFVHNGKHIEIYKSYSKSIWGKGTGSLIAALYITLSILVFISLIWLK